LFISSSHSPTTSLSSLSLHDALPISRAPTHRTCIPCGPRPDSAHGIHVRRETFGALRPRRPRDPGALRPRRPETFGARLRRPETDRKSTRLNSSHVKISYAVFCLKKK